MPPPVDHDEKRRRVIKVASRLLAKSGLGALTVRDVAHEAGYSTTIVTHYFKNKDELLTLIVKYNHARFVTITDEALRKSGSDLKAFMTSVMLPEDHSIQWWRVCFAYIAQLDSHPEISSIHRDFTKEQRERWVVILNSMTARGLLKPGLDIEHVADRLIAAIIGLAISAIFDLDAWPPERQHALIDAELETVLRVPPNAWAKT